MTEPSRPAVTAEHLDDEGRFQSDKYPWCRPDFVPLKVTDPMAQPVLWAYAQARREVDAAFADDLERRLVAVGYNPPTVEPKAQSCVRLYPDGGFAGGTFEAPTVADIKRCVEQLKTVQAKPDDEGFFTFLLFASEADRKAYEQALRAHGKTLPKGMVLTP